VPFIFHFLFFYNFQTTSISIQGEVINKAITNNKMGNTNSMNNMSLLDQKRYQAEFLRYSQIPYDSQYLQQQQPQSIHASNMNLHQINKYKDQHPLSNPVKVLPDVKFEPKLRTTNNGAILSSGGTISGRKDSEVSHTFLMRFKLYLQCSVLYYIFCVMTTKKYFTKEKFTFYSLLIFLSFSLLTFITLNRQSSSCVVWLTSLKKYF
jgi:hypothetical protein